MKFSLAIATLLAVGTQAKAPKHHEFEAVQGYTFKEYVKDFSKVRTLLQVDTGSFLAT